MASAILPRGCKLLSGMVVAIMAEAESSLQMACCWHANMSFDKHCLGLVSALLQVHAADHNAYTAGKGS